MADFTELDAAFTLPEWVNDVRLRGLYEVLVSRFRVESEHVPLNTAQQILIERLASGYIIHRYREGRALGDRNGFGTAAAAKDSNNMLLQLLHQHTETLARFRPPDKAAVASAVRQAAAEALAAVPEGTLRQEAARGFQDALERAGVI